jgi:hypothetical protein
MVKLNGVPIQPFVFGVTVIVAITGVKPRFIVLKLAIFPLPDAAKPMDGVSFIQSNVVPVTFPVKEIAPLAAPLHLTKFAIGFTVGFGLTVMVKVLGTPEQVLATGVIVIVAIKGVFPVFIAVNDGMEFVPEVAIPILVVLDVQLYVVPETDPVKSICVLVSPAQRTTFGVVLTSGFGFTDTTTSNGVPEHPLTEGVTE